MLRLCRRIFASRASVFVFAFTLGIGTTALIGVAAATSHGGDLLYERLEVFANVVSHIKNNYVEDVDESKLVYGAIRGMVNSLDPHSAFMDPDEYRNMLDDSSSGEFGGLGFEFFQKDEALVVLSAIDDSPAAAAGLQSGDQILAIDGTPTRGMTLGDATRRLKGQPGTTVRLLLMRHGFQRPLELPLTRAKVRVVAVDGRLIDGSVGYVRIKSFQDHTDDDLRLKLSSLRTQAGPEFKGLILDLRNNPGGLLEQGVKVADRFLSNKGATIVTTRGRGGRHPEPEYVTGRDPEPNYPMVVLLNRGSASASEVVAGALQDYRRAVLMGSTSFGKGSVQTVMDLRDGSALKLTIARYYTPSGRTIQGKGITPDVLVTTGTENEDRGEWTLPGIIVAHDMPGAVQPPAPVEAAAVIPDVPGGEQLTDEPLRDAVRAIEGWDRFKDAIQVQRARTGAASFKPAPG